MSDSLAHSIIAKDIRERCHKHKQGACSTCEKLTSLDVKIQENRRELERLVNEQNTTVLTANQQHDPFSNRIPTEVVSRIFVHCLPDQTAAYTTRERLDWQVHMKAVLLLNHVCRKWRHIAEATHQLWATICANVTPRNCAGVFDTVQEWLRRSGNLPLFVQLSLPTPGEPIVDHFTKRILSSTIPHADRWEVLDLKMSTSLIPWLSSALAGKQMHRLNYLKINFLPTEDSISNILHLDAFPARITQRQGLMKHLSVNLTKLTSIDINRLSIEDARTLFSEAVQLTSCVLHRVLNGAVSSSNRIKCSALSSLTIIQPPTQFWDHFTFPVLEALRSMKPAHGSSPARHYVRLCEAFRQSGCSPAMLSIVDTPTDPEGFTELLKLSPGLQYLSIGGGMVHGEIFRLMNNAAESHEFLPKLLFLGGNLSGLAINWTWLILFLASMRARTPASLEYFELLCDQEYLDQNIGMLPDDVHSKLLLDTAADMDFKMEDANGVDLIEKLRIHHDL